MSDDLSDRLASTATRSATAPIQCGSAMADSPPASPAVSRKRQSAINLTFNYVNIVMVIVQGIVLTPLYLHYISPALYGSWLATGNILSWIGLVDPGVSRIMQQRIAHTAGRRDPEQLRLVIGTGLFLGTILSMLPLLAMPFSGMITGTFELPPDESKQLSLAFQLEAVATCLLMASFQPAAANLGLQIGVGSGMSYTCGAIAGIIATCVLLSTGFGLLSLPIGSIVRATVLLIGNAGCMWAWTARNLGNRLAIRSDELKTYSTLATFTFIERIGAALLTQSDSFLAAKVIAPESAAVYSLTGRAYEPVRMAADRLCPSFLPGLAHLAGEGRRDRLLEISDRLFTLLSYIVSVGAACVVALNFAFVQLWVGPAFFGGQKLTILLAGVVVFNVILSSLAEIVFAIGGVGRIQIMRAAEGVVRVIAQYVLLKWFGILGIPIGSCVGLLLVSGWYLPTLAAEKFEQGPWETYRKLLVCLLHAAVLLGCGFLSSLVFKQVVLVWTWPRFILSGMVVAVMLNAVGLAINGAMRNELLRLVSHITGRVPHELKR